LVFVFLTQGGQTNFPLTTTGETARDKKKIIKKVTKGSETQCQNRATCGDEEKHHESGGGWGEGGKKEGAGTRSKVTPNGQLTQSEKTENHGIGKKRGTTQQKTNHGWGERLSTRDSPRKTRGTNTEKKVKPYEKGPKKPWKSSKKKKPVKQPQNPTLCASKNPNHTSKREPQGVGYPKKGGEHSGEHQGRNKRGKNGHSKLHGGPKKSNDRARTNKKKKKTQKQLYTERTTGGYGGKGKQKKPKKRGHTPSDETKNWEKKSPWGGWGGGGANTPSQQHMWVKPNYRNGQSKTRPTPKLITIQTTLEKENQGKGGRDEKKHQKAKVNQW